jgi:hypothetical protein
MEVCPGRKQASETRMSATTARRGVAVIQANADPIRSARLGWISPEVVAVAGKGWLLRERRDKLAEFARSTTTASGI